VNRYSCNVPIVGFVYVEVEAESKEGAIAAALEAAGEVLRGEQDPTGPNELMELEAVRAITTGNVFHGACNEIDAEIVDGEP
jgi:hypothetical protein